MIATILACILASFNIETANAITFTPNEYVYSPIAKGRKLSSFTDFKEDASQLNENVKNTWAPDCYSSTKINHLAIMNIKIY